MLGEVADDLRSERAMARMVQGDVGSGKTAVAFAAIALAHAGGLAVVDDHGNAHGVVALEMADDVLGVGAFARGENGDICHTKNF